MENKHLQQELENQFTHVVSRDDLFQSDWDIVSFTVFFIFIGVILLLVLLVLIHCCCWDDGKVKRHRRKVGVENMALEPCNRHCNPGREGR
ncbi:small integral membrane protein 22 isoform X2 [Clinocottus analis]|uniref:small integral membrane protein 22 isoform X2 n=1 Tax=Clinocottus analis TaxID=304258 RepID=UPI0035C170F7